MKRKSIKDVLPKRQKKVLLQVRIDEAVLNGARLKRIKDRVTWRVLIETCLKQYLKED